MEIIRFFVIIIINLKKKFLNRKRMTAHECLIHPWLKGDHTNRTESIDNNRYKNFRDKIRAQYDNWDKYILPIGRLAEYSALRKLLIEKYRIIDTTIGNEFFFFKNRFLNYSNQL